MKNKLRALLIPGLLFVRWLAWLILGLAGVTVLVLGLVNQYFL